MKTVKAKFIGISKNEFDSKKSKVCLPISVGQLYHEGEKLAATLNAATQRFDHVTVIVADTLQRYNFLDQLTYDEALDYSVNLGTDWINRNDSYLSKNNSKMIRWDECLSWHTFQDVFHKIIIYYNQSLSFQNKLQETVNLFLSRRKISPCHQQIKNSTDYLLEEISVIFSYLLDNEYHYIAYPGSFPLIFNEAKNSLFNQSLNKYLNVIKIKFHKY